MKFARRSQERVPTMPTRSALIPSLALLTLVLTIALAPGFLAAQDAAPAGEVGVLWKLDIPAGYEPGMSVAFGDALLNTATSEEFGSNLTVYDLRTGAFRWNHAAAEPLSDPFVADDVVYLTAGPRVIALALADGALLWEQALDDGEPARGDAPSRVVAANGTVYVNVNASLQALDAATGEPRWQRTFEGYAVDVPVLAGAVVVVASAPVDPALDGTDNRLHGISAESGNEVWRWGFAALDGTYAYSGGGSIVHLARMTGGGWAYDLLDAGKGRPAWDVAGTCDPSADVALLGDIVACGDLLLDGATGEALPGGPLPDGMWPLGRIGDQLVVTDGARVAGLDVASRGEAWSAEPAGDADAAQAPTFVTISAGDGAFALVTATEPSGDAVVRFDAIILGTADDGATPVATPVATPAS